MYSNSRGRLGTGPMSYISIVSYFVNLHNPMNTGIFDDTNWTVRSDYDNYQLCVTNDASVCKE